MSRVDDLMGLIQTTNEIYLINPFINVRSAYIQIDDICELAMKSWLQIDTIHRQQHCQDELTRNNIIRNRGHRDRLRNYFDRLIDEHTLQTNLGIATGSAEYTLLQGQINANLVNGEQTLLKWSPDLAGTNRFKNFHDIIEEVKDRTALPANDPLYNVLDQIQHRRDNRNHFFHDHDQAGLTVNDKNCLDAFMDLFFLMASLFPNEYPQSVRANSVVQAQIAIIRLKFKGYTTRVAEEEYKSFLREHGVVRINYGSFGHEISVIYNDTGSLLRRIQQQFRAKIGEIQNKIDHINGLQRRSREHVKLLEALQSQLETFQTIYDDCLS